MSKLADEIQQSQPFASREVEAFLNLMRTADQLRRAGADLLRPYGLSGTGYNVLRILRGAGENGLPCSEVSARLVAQDPDVTRLADRLIAAGWIVRDRARGDRRVVILRLAPAGADLLERIDAPMSELHRSQFSHLPPEALDTLIDLLEQVRHPPITASEHP